MRPLLKTALVIIILLVSGTLGFLLSFYMHQDKTVFVPPQDTEVLQTFHYPTYFVKQLKGDPDAGRKIFNEYCTSCHGREPIIDIKAPHIGDKKAWKPRQKIGIDALLKITTTGVGAMPARGGCFECSDAQLRQTIQYILKESVQNRK